MQAFCSYSPQLALDASSFDHKMQAFGSYSPQLAAYWGKNMRCIVCPWRNERELKNWAKQIMRLLSSLFFAFVLNPLVFFSFPFIQFSLYNIYVCPLDQNFIISYKVYVNQDSWACAKQEGSLSECVLSQYFLCYAARGYVQRFLLGCLGEFLVQGDEFRNLPKV